MTPEKAIQYLKEGNERFLSNLSVNRNSLQLVNDTADKQFPFAAILSCSDSRVPTELVFDQGLGDIFSVRLAGNIATIFATASLEYACKYLGSKLILVLGHTGCGAVSAACDDLDDGNIHNILDLIRPALEAETQTIENRNSSNKDFTNEICRLNVIHQIKMVLENSEVLNELLDKKEIMIAGAVYNVEDGRVDFLDISNTIIKQHDESKIYER